jgi:hypothetical protein
MHTYTVTRIVLSVSPFLCVFVRIAQGIQSGGRAFHNRAKAVHATVGFRSDETLELILRDVVLAKVT